MALSLTLFVDHLKRWWFWNGACKHAAGWPWVECWVISIQIHLPLKWKKT